MSLARAFADIQAWWQLLALAVGLALAWWARRTLQRRWSNSNANALKELDQAVLLFPLALLSFWLGATYFGFKLVRLPAPFLYYSFLLVGGFALVRAVVLILRYSLATTPRLKAWEGVLTFAIWGLLVLHGLDLLPGLMQKLDRYALTIGKVEISLYSIVSFTLALAVLVLLALWLSGTIHNRLLRSDDLDVSAKLAFAKLAKFSLIVLAVVIAMVTAGIDLTALTVFGGALGVGLGLGLQRVVSNFISGFILVFEESIRPGDVISLGDTHGVVHSLNARHVVLHTPDGTDVLIPNEELVLNRLTSWSYGDRNVRLKLNFTVALDADLPKALAILEQTAASEARVLKAPPSQAYLTAITPQGIQIELGVWIGDPENGIAEPKSHLLLACMAALRADGIALATA